MHNFLIRQHRESGNEAYKSKKNMEALQEYTNALLHCEDQKSETMAMAYANRSAVLMAIGSNEALVSAIRSVTQYYKDRGVPSNCNSSQITLAFLFQLYRRAA